METSQFQANIQKMIAESIRKKCDCGCEYFDTVTTIVPVSALISGTGKNETLLVGVLVCRKCGKENVKSQIETP